MVPGRWIHVACMQMTPSSMENIEISMENIDISMENVRLYQHIYGKCSAIHDLPYHMIPHAGSPQLC